MKLYYLVLALGPTSSASGCSGKDRYHETNHEQQYGEIRQHDRRLPNPQLALLHLIPTFGMSVGPAAQVGFLELASPKRWINLT